jgi:hypothetical protein
MMHGVHYSSVPKFTGINDVNRNITGLDVVTRKYSLVCIARKLNNPTINKAPEKRGGRI